MAKKKQKKDKKKGFAYSNEVIGILIILVSIIGIGGYGPAGNFIRAFAIFLVGNIYLLLLILLLVAGGFLILKREPPKLFTTRMIGLYIVTLSFLILLHVKYIELNGSEGIKIITETFENLMLAFKNTNNVSNSGGGIIGAIFSWGFVSLFGDGTIIVVVSLIILGTILLFNVSLLNIFNKVKDFIDRNREDEGEEDKKSIINNHDEPRKDVVISNSVEEKIQIEETVKDRQEPDIDIPIVEKPVINTMAKEEVEDPVVINSINENYQLPPISILKTIKSSSNKENETQAKENIGKLEQVLNDFGISGKVVQVNIGPTVTQYELELKTGTKVNMLLSIEREIALSLAAKTIKIQAPIPGKHTIGIELPNKKLSSVSFKEVLTRMPDVNDSNLLAVGLGKDIMGKVKWMEINKTPHLLVAGATGSGKSVCMNCIITSILMRTKPDQVKLVMVDPKKVELTMYNGVPHLMCPVVTDPKKASVALKNIVAEMEKRYDIFERNKVKNIAGYNKLAEDNPEEFAKMPYIVVIIDELADLMLVAKKEVEDSIMRITQMARAAGIHLIVATQRPSTDVITGVVKSNIPSRISFAVSSNIDSRTILDAGGAEKLLGKGDMLFLPMGENSPTRIQGAYVDEDEIQKVVDYVCEQQKANYDNSLTEMRNDSSSHNDGYESDDEYDDPLYNEIVDFTITSGKISASLIQRKYRIGYNRAARIVDLLEERGIIGPQNGSKPREVLIKKDNNIEE